MLRGLLIAFVAIASVAGVLVTGTYAEQAAVAAAGPDLTRLLRAMAALEMMIASGVLAAIIWRLGAPASWLRFSAYAAAVSVMAFGPGLIWSMANVGAGAALVHGGLISSVLILWRDPAIEERLRVSHSGALARLVGAKLSQA